MSAVSELLKRSDVPEDEWRNTIADILSVSYGTATKRLQEEESFSLDELFKIAKHYRTTVCSMLQSVYPDEKFTPAEHTRAQLKVGSYSLDCDVTIQPGAQRAGNFMVAYQLENQTWRVAHVTEAEPDAVLYNVGQITFAGPRIAVVDDEAPTTLVRFLTRQGFDATHFSEPGPVLRLIESDRAPDAYILDWTLGHGETSEGLIDAIRRKDKTCPIVLLTGTIQSKQSNESEIARVVGKYNIELYEKPTRLLILAQRLQVMLGRHPFPVASGNMEQ